MQRNGVAVNFLSMVRNISFYVLQHPVSNARIIFTFIPKLWHIILANLVKVIFINDYQKWYSCILKLQGICYISYFVWLPYMLANEGKICRIFFFIYYIFSNTLLKLDSWRKSGNLILCCTYRQIQ